MTLGAIGFYTLFVLIVPYIVPLVFGAESQAAVPAILVMSIFGGVTMVGGLFGPLYRALDLMRPAVLIKAVTLVMVLLPAWLVLQNRDLFARGTAGYDMNGSVLGAWMINGLYIISAILTAWIALAALNRKT
jgi:hypothetical protein